MSDSATTIRQRVPYPVRPQQQPQAQPKIEQAKPQPQAQPAKPPKPPEPDITLWTKVQRKKGRARLKLLTGETIEGKLGDFGMFSVAVKPDGSQEVVVFKHAITVAMDCTADVERKAPPVEGESAEVA